MVLILWKLIIVAILEYIVFALTGGLNNTFGIISKIIFFLKAGYLIVNEEALIEPRIIMLLLGFLSFQELLELFSLIPYYPHYLDVGGY